MNSEVLCIVGCSTQHVRNHRAAAVHVVLYFIVYLGGGRPRADVVEAPPAIGSRLQKRLCLILADLACGGIGRVPCMPLH